MPYVTISDIGLAERKVVELLLNDIIVGDKTTASMVKRLRRQLDLRSVRDEIIEATEMKRAREIERDLERMWDVLSDDELEKRRKFLYKEANIGLSWDDIIAWSETEDGYGQEYKVDKTTLEWLSNRRAEKEHWVNKYVEEGEETVERPVAIPAGLLEAIGSLDEAIGKALNSGE